MNIWREIDVAGAGLVAPDTDSGTEELLRKFLALTPAERVAKSRAGIALYRERFTSRAAGEGLLQVLKDIALVRPT